MRNIKEIIIHCTATREGTKVIVADVDRWHRAMGFDGIGYHYLIGLQGEVWKGRPEEKAGAHTVGHNSISIGVCYVGGLDRNGKPKDTRTAPQKASLKALVKELQGRYPGATVHGHREFANKACPCFDVSKEF